MTFRRPSGRVVLVAGIVLVLVAGAAAWFALRRGSELERAVGLLPADTSRITWTDWAGVRAELGVDRVTPGTPEADDLLLRAGDLDLSAASPTASIATDLQKTLGWNPLASDWELLGQSSQGMVLLVRLPESVDLAKVADRYRAAGFTRPKDRALDGAVWRGGPNKVAALPGLNQPLLQHVALVEDQRLLVSSDQSADVERTVKVLRGDADGLDAGLVAPAGDALAAAGYTDDTVCSRLSMASADPGVRAQAQAQVEEAGGVHPLTGYLVALGRGGTGTVVFELEKERQAEADRDPRTRLAGMEDPAQGLAYADAFRIAESRVDGSRVVLELDEVAERTYPLTNTTTGQVLIAAC